jgi:hypothetical protein
MSDQIEILNPANSIALNVVSSLAERNRLAKEAIKQTALDHAKWDMAVGAAGMFGLAIPALIVAIATQGPMFYKPLAEKLTRIYNVEPDGKTQAIIRQNMLVGSVVDIAGEFTTEFLMMIAGELFTELSLGTAASFIPGVGAVIGAALDYIIATTMTWRVGVMVSIYCQNGNQWVGSKKHTFELAKEITGGLNLGLTDLLSMFGANGKRPVIDIDLNSIPKRVPEVKKWQVEHLKQFVLMAFEMGGADMARQQLRKRGVPTEMIEAALTYAMKNMTPA